MSGKERVVFLNHAAFTEDDLSIPNFEHNWSEYPGAEAADLVPRLFGATTAITHGCPIDAEAIGLLHKLNQILVTGPATVGLKARTSRGIVVRQLSVLEAPGRTLTELFETLFSEAGG